jgi:hypothetical protein
MRHRSQSNDASPATPAGNGVTGTLATLTELLANDPDMTGKHRAPIAPRIPQQLRPTHELPMAEATVAEATVAEATVAEATVAEAPVVEAPVVEAPVAKAYPIAAPVVTPSVEIPDSAEWRASHLPRVFAGSLLALATLGTAGLGVRFAQSRAGDDLISLAIGLAVVVILWGVLIASTPQKVSLRGSQLTVHNTSGSERFDLADGLQPVDLVGDPRTSHWAVLLHRPNSTTVVLRKHDVNAAELHPIVRHYRNVAEQKLTDRQARFDL